MDNNQQIDVSWPPEYKVVDSCRAKHLQLKISPQQGLQVIVPTRCKNPDIDNLLIKSRRWIEKHLPRYQQRAKTNTHLPMSLELRAIAQTWQVNYKQCDIITKTNKFSLLELPGEQLTLYGDVSDHTLCKGKLKQWLKRQANIHFNAWMQNLSQQTNLYYKKISVRGQKTRWGSCNQQQEINLNYKLLFLPPEYVKHTMIHELCHTKYMNHSKRFWQLVAKHDPDWQKYRRCLQADSYVPAWLDT